MEPDAVDRVIADWKAALPDLDPSGLGLAGRVLVLAGHLERGVAAALEPHGLTLGQFDILATLRRHGPAGGLSPGRLLKAVVLSSGGMTGRLDRLEADGLVVRRPDPADRRAVVVDLTPAGRARIEAAAAARFAEADRAAGRLSADDRRRLADLLRAWLRTWESAVGADGGEVSGGSVKFS